MRQRDKNLRQVVRHIAAPVVCNLVVLVDSDGALENLQLAMRADTDAEGRFLTRRALRFVIGELRNCYVEGLLASDALRELPDSPCCAMERAILQEVAAVQTLAQGKLFGSVG